MLATSLVLCAAVLHATWNTLVKFSSDRLLVVACVVGVSRHPVVALRQPAAGRSSAPGCSAPPSCNCSTGYC